MEDSHQNGAQSSGRNQHQIKMHPTRLLPQDAAERTLRKLETYRNRMRVNVTDSLPSKTWYGATMPSPLAKACPDFKKGKGGTWPTRKDAY